MSVLLFAMLDFGPVRAAVEAQAAEDGQKISGVRGVDHVLSSLGSALPTSNRRRSLCRRCLWRVSLLHLLDQNKAEYNVSAEAC